MLQYFNYLTKEELLLFSKFIISPVYNKYKTIVNLFEYLRSKFPNITGEDICPHQLSLHVYEEEVVNEAKIRKLVSDFGRLFEKFLVYLETERSSAERAILLLSAFRKRGILKKFNMNFKDIYAGQNSKFSKDAQYYMDQINLENETYYYNLDKYKLEFAECLQKKSDSINHLFVFMKLHVFFEMLQNALCSSRDIAAFRREFCEEVLAFVESNKASINQEHPNIFVIYNVLMMWITDESNYLDELFCYLNLNKNKFTADNLSYYYNYIVSYYMHRISRGRTEHRKDVFRIFKLMREENLFLIDYVITDTEFYNVIITSLPLKEFDWTESFIEEYKEHLTSAYAKDVYNIAKAMLAFYRKDFDDVFPYLNEVEFRDPKYYFNSKALLARVYFEKKDMEAVRCIVDCLSQYLQDKKTLSPEHIKITKTFIKYMRALINLHESPHVKKKTLKIILKKELDNEKSFVSNKGWFYEKVEEAGNKNQK